MRSTTTSSAATVRSSMPRTARSTSSSTHTKTAIAVRSSRDLAAWRTAVTRREIVPRGERLHAFTARAVDPPDADRSQPTARSMPATASPRRRGRCGRRRSGSRPATIDGRRVRPRRHRLDAPPRAARNSSCSASTRCFGRGIGRPRRTSIGSAAAARSRPNPRARASTTVERHVGAERPADQPRSARAGHLAPPPRRPPASMSSGSPLALGVAAFAALHAAEVEAQARIAAPGQLVEQHRDHDDCASCRRTADAGGTTRPPRVPAWRRRWPRPARLRAPSPSSVRSATWRDGAIGHASIPTDVAHEREHRRFVTPRVVAARRPAVARAHLGAQHDRVARGRRAPRSFATHFAGSQYCTRGSLSPVVTNIAGYGRAPTLS